MMRVLALLVAPAIAQTFNERIQDIVSNMTMDEKYSMLNGVGWSTVRILMNSLKTLIVLDSYSSY
jgi:CheY-specific phosphatase CheX